TCVRDRFGGQQPGIKPGPPHDRWMVSFSAYPRESLNSDLLPFSLADAGPLRVVFQVTLSEVAGRDHDFHIRDAQVGGRPPQHPGGRIFFVLVYRLVEVDLVEVASDRQPMQRDTLLTTLALEVLAEVNRRVFLPCPTHRGLIIGRAASS